jgi:hypothetical protein
MIPPPIFLRIDLDTDFLDDEFEIAIAIQTAKEWEAKRKAGITQPLKPHSQTPE